MARELSAKSEAAVTAELPRRRLSPEDRLGVLIEIEATRTERRIAATGVEPTYTPGESEAMRWLKRLGVTGPISVQELEHRMTEAGMDSTLRIAVKVEADQHRWLRAGGARHVQAGRDLRASADQQRPCGTLLVDRRGQPRVLRSYPE